MVRCRCGILPTCAAAGVLALASLFWNSDESDLGTFSGHLPLEANGAANLVKEASGVWLPLKRGESRSVQLNGDPKSGTTLTETIAFFAASMLCRRDTDPGAGDAPCHITGVFNQTKEKEFHLAFPRSEASAHFTIGNKHTILGTHGPAECQRGEPPLSPPIAPCHVKALQLAQLEACFRHCFDPSYHGGDLQTDTGIILLVWRDVRNQVVSTCFSDRRGNYWPRMEAAYRKALPRCIRHLFPTLALWARYRQLWYNKVHFPRQLVHVCYEGLIHQPFTEYRKVLAALGLEVSNTQLARLVRETRPERLQSSSNADIALKVRDAGSRSYRRYGLSKAMIDWMDAAYVNLSFELDPYLL